MEAATSPASVCRCSIGLGARGSIGGVGSALSGRRREMPPGGNVIGGSNGSARLQGSFQLAVGAHVHHVSSALHLRVLVIAQVECRDPYRRAGAAAHHALVAFHPVVHRIPRAHQVQAAREVEGEIVIGEAVSARRIPVAARTDKVHMLAGIVDHLARMPELELVLAPGAQRFRRRHQEQAVAAARQVQPRAFGLQHLRRHAIHAHLRHRHLARNLERRHRHRRRRHSHLHA